MKKTRTGGVHDVPWDDLKVFLAIIRQGSLVGAAQTLGQSQPTMGRRLQALEKAMGCKLVQRTSEGFRPTEDGLAVLSHAERMEEEALSFTRRLAGRRHEVEGTLRVTSSDWLASHLLAPITVQLFQKYPRLVVELGTDVHRVNFERREADLVVCFTRFEGAHVVQKWLTHAHYGVYASRAYLQQRGLPHPSTSGAGHELIVMQAPSGLSLDTVWLMKLLPLARVLGRSDSRGVQARICAAGGGLAVLPLQVAEATPGLVTVDLGELPPSREIWAGYHRDFQRHPRLRALLDAVDATLSSVTRTLRKPTSGQKTG